MATSIGTSAGTTLTNMKPIPGEQTDALWAQNIADNSGYSIFRVARIALSVSGSGSGYAAMFTKTPGITTLYVRVRGNHTGVAAAVTDAYYIHADGTDATGTSGAVLTYSNAFTRGVDTTNVFSMDISSLTDNTEYYLKIVLDNTKDFHVPSVYL